jgi:hypothetical protein
MIYKHVVTKPTEVVVCEAVRRSSSDTFSETVEGAILKAITHQSIGKHHKRLYF